MRFIANDCRQALRAPGSGQTEWHKPELPARNCWADSGPYHRKSCPRRPTAKIKMKPDATLAKLASNAIPTRCFCAAKALRLRNNQAALAAAPAVTAPQR